VVGWVRMIGAGLIGCWPVLVAGQDLFQLHVQTTAGEPLERVVGASNLPRLVRDMVDTRGDFAAFEGRDILGRVRYAGVDNAVLLTLNADATAATLRLPHIGYERTFTADQGDLDDQVRDFLLEEGAEQYAAFLREMNRLSPVAVDDGNPRATTAFMADSAFSRHAFYSGWVLSEPGVVPRGRSITRLELNTGRFESDGFSGTYISGALAGGWRITERVSLAYAIPAQYRDIEGARVYDLGAELALPIRILTTIDERGGWQIAPLVQGAGVFSEDMAAGGVLWGAGISNSVAWHVDPWTIAIGNQFIYYEGTPLRIGDYRLETNLYQPILKNGLRVQYDISRSFYIDGSGIYSNFTRSKAFYRNYWTVSLGLGARLGATSGIRVAYITDFKEAYRSHGVTGLLHLRW
jgi:hypothetical protein